MRRTAKNMLTKRLIEEREGEGEGEGKQERRRGGPQLFVNS